MSNIEKNLPLELLEDNDSDNEFLESWFALSETTATESRRSSRPDIFTNPNKDIINTNIYNYSEKMNPMTLHEIFIEHHDNFRNCTGAVAQYLSSVFELADPPSITYSIADDNNNVAGSYSYSDNNITFYYKEDRDDIVVFEDLYTIAHEMWHAHQYSVADKDEPDANSELYKKNFDDYIDSDEDYHGYMTQLVEAEARAFASVFVEDCYNAINHNNIQRKKMGKLGRKILPIYLAFTIIGAGIGAAQAEKNCDKVPDIEPLRNIEEFHHNNPEDPIIHMELSRSSNNINVDEDSELYNINERE